MVAILSDIHGNLEAFDAVIEESLNRDVDTFIMLGDFVDYGADSVEIVNRVYEMTKVFPVISIGGNHDYSVLKADPSRFRTLHGRESFKITMKEMSQNPDTIHQLNMIALQPRQFNKSEKQIVSLVHGSLSDRLWGSIGEVIPFVPKTKFMSGASEIVFCGHSHIPGFCYDFNKEYNRVFINPGSVGQPRNGNSKASFLVSDDTLSLFEHVTVDYDVDTAARKIVDSGRPEFLATRLYIGM